MTVQSIRHIYFPQANPNSPLIGIGPLSPKLVGNMKAALNQLKLGVRVFSAQGQAPGAENAIAIPDVPELPARAAIISANNGGRVLFMISNNFLNTRWIDFAGGTVPNQQNSGEFNPFIAPGLIRIGGDAVTANVFANNLEIIAFI